MWMMAKRAKTVAQKSSPKSRRNGVAVGARAGAAQWLWRPWVALLPLCLAATGCNGGAGSSGPGGSSGGGGDFDRRALLAQFANGVVLPLYSEAASTAAVLADAVDAYAAEATAAGAATVALEAARAAWLTAWRAWQRAEVLVLGPAAPVGFSPEAVGLRDEIYSWPIVNPCRIDQALVAREYEAEDFIADSLVNVYGFDALEYLLFFDGTDNQCAPQLDINSDGSWDALGADELTRRRAQYAAVVARAVADNTAALLAAWQPDDGGFATRLASAGEEGSPYATVQDALDDVFAAIFYVEVITKDLKLAEPLNLNGACSAAPCLDEVESPWADAGAAAIAANLEALAWAVRGGGSDTNAVGFDDWLVAVGQEALATQLLADIAAAIAAAEGLEGSLRQALVEDLASVEALHTAVKKVTDQLKNNFSTLLLLTIPSDAAGDTD